MTAERGRAREVGAVPFASRIYLDWAATGPPRPEALAAARAVEDGAWGNPSSAHAAGRQARAVVERARRQVAGLLRCDPTRLIFTSGGTEAANLAVLGTAGARPERRHLVLSAIEHHCVLDACRALGRSGYSLTLVAPDREGRIAAADIAAALRPETALCALMLANNEVAALQPVAEAAAACRAAGVPLLVDAVAAAGRVPVEPAALGADLLALSAHKLGGCKGAGALYVGPGCALAPLLHGGGQERRWRPGTENVSALAAFGVAAELAAGELPARAARLAALEARLRAAVASAGCGALATGPAQAAARVPGLVSYAFPGLDGEALLVSLDLEGVAASAGAACTSGSLEPSHVLAAMGLPPEACRASLRLSLGAESSEAELEAAAAALGRAVRRQIPGWRPAAARV